MKIRIVGCGSPDGGDDRLGIETVRRLRGILPANVEIVEDPAGGARAEAWCDGAGALLIVDAAAPGPASPPGTRLRFRYPQDRARLAGTALRATHAISIEQGLRLAETMGLLPREVRIYAVAAARFDTGAPLSPEVEAALDGLVATIRAEVARIDPG